MAILASMSTRHDRAGQEDANTAWAAVGRLAAGPLFYGGVGYGLDHLLHTAPVFLCLGVLLGFALGIYLTIAVLDAQGRATASAPSTVSRRDQKGHSRGR